MVVAEAMMRSGQIMALFWRQRLAGSLILCGTEDKKEAAKMTGGQGREFLEQKKGWNSQ